MTASPKGRTVMIAPPTLVPRGLVCQRAEDGIDHLDLGCSKEHHLQDDRRRAGARREDRVQGLLPGASAHTPTRTEPKARYTGLRPREARPPSSGRAGPLENGCGPWAGSSGAGRVAALGWRTALLRHANPCRRCESFDF